MSSYKTALLHDRGIVRVSGSEATQWLANLVTNDLTPTSEGKAVYAGLLSPQGKILFDFFVVQEPDGSLLIDIEAARVPDFVKRLTLYKLRTPVTIEDASPDYDLMVLWQDGADADAGDSLLEITNSPEGLSYQDPRLPALGVRSISKRATGLAHGELSQTANDYHAHRIALGVPEGGKDWEYSATFPHEALFDQLAGVSFTKGCYVGQEIVSRMEHRGTARKRIVNVTAQDHLPADHPDIQSGAAAIGRMGSVAGKHGLALVRLDRAREARDRGEAIMVAGQEVAIIVPAYANFNLDEPSDEKASP